MEHPFDEIDGVLSTTSGYTGGQTVNPTYEQVSAGSTGHTESVQVLYDPAKVSYERLLDVFWRQIDPTTRDQQFVDHGSQYRTAVFYHNEDQRRAAEASRDALEKSGRFGAPIVTEIQEAGVFYAAEDYHQDFYEKNSLRYTFYRLNSGRDQYLARIWADEK